MAQAEWDQIVDLFHAAREKSGDERVMLLDAACGENTVFRKVIEELLREDEAASGFLSEPLFGSRPSAMSGTRIVPGQRFGRYITVALIGRGGMGEVWSAQDADLDRIVALKFLSSEAFAALDSRHIVHEAKAASALNHPGIVTIHEVVQSESKMAIAMELVEGTSLREVMGKPLPITKVLAIGLQIAEALVAAHAGDIIHGDIKPENIFLRQDQYVKVLDFGLARKVTTETIAFGGSFALGTLRYLSPEQARDEPLTPASDVFSFGLVLYELATGQHAFPANSSLDTAQAILTREPLPPSSVNPAIPSRLDLLLRAMLIKEPAGRPSAQMVARTLRELQGLTEVSTAFIPAAWKWVMVAIVFVAACFAVWRWKEAWEERNAPSFRQITTLVPENRATAAAISPDGKWAAYANVDGIFLQAIQNGEVKALSAPANYVVDRLAWFADGTKLVASGFSTLTNVPSIWIIFASDVAPQLMREHAREATPSPDGAQVVFVTQDYSEIWVVRTDGKQPRKVITGPGEDTFQLVFWSPDGRRISFQRRHYSPEQQRLAHGDFERFYERSYESIELITGVTTARVPAMGVASLAALPDSRILFLRYVLTRADAPDQLWEVKTDPATGKFTETPRKVANPVDQYEDLIYGMSASSDGKQVMVLKRSEQNTVFIGDFEEAVPRVFNIRRLTFDERTSFPHAWTADSNSVIFESLRRGTWDLFKQEIDQRTPKTLVATPWMEVLPHLSPDGRWVLYSAAPKIERGTYRLMRVPVDGGTPQEVPIGGRLDEFRCALGPSKGCVLRTTVGREYYVFYELDPIRGKGRELARTKWIPNVTEDWDVSPDGTQVAIPNHDSREARIRLVNLQPDSTRTAEREVILPELADLNGVVWSASGHGWFVSVNMTVGKRLLYVYPNGSFRPLGDIPGWAVPSPDGRRVAFVNTITATNAWLIERR
ncbi:MAG: protein kinase [Acidobacteriaceae bacterium]|nr:protein kinase [Acidobacteriaceae bacterium]